MPRPEEMRTGTAHPPTAPVIDTHVRDPFHLNVHLRTDFEEVIAEPHGSHSAECVWVNSYKAFELGKHCCYGCLAYTCAIPLAFCWGCNFACITFMHIWSITPLFRVFRINCDCASKFFSTVVHCCCDPCYEAMALMFTKMYVHLLGDVPAFKEKTYSGTDQLLVERSGSFAHVQQPHQYRV